MDWVIVTCMLFALTNADTTPTNGRSALWTDTWTDLLKHDLFLKYDKFARPSQQYNTTHIEMDVAFKHILVDEKKSMVTVNTWTKFLWTDDKLKWNSSDYGGQYSLHIAEHEIWQPDIVLYNSAQGNAIDHFGNTHCIVTNNGLVLWVPPSQFFVYCEINLRKWPYDTQTCMLQFGSWTYSVREIDLSIDTSGKLGPISDLDPCEWKIISTKKNRVLSYYACCPEPYPRLDFIFTMQRKTSFFTGLVFLPALVCIVLTLSVFLLPPTAGEKFLVSGITAIIVTLLTIYFTQKLSVVTGQIPIIVEFYIYSLVLVCLSLVTSVVTVNISRQSKARPVPWIMTRLLTSRVGRLLRLPHIKKQDSCPEQETEELHERSLVSDMVQDKTNPTNSVRDWILFAMAIDRLMFIAYILIFTILLTVLFLT